MKLPGLLQRMRGKADTSLSLLEESLSLRAAPPLLQTFGWISAGAGALAIGLMVGRELRQRYKFKRRTPYERYAHAGASLADDFGLGV